MLNLNDIYTLLKEQEAKLEKLEAEEIELEVTENAAYARAEAVDLPEADWSAADEAAEKAHADRVRNEYHMDRVRTVVQALQALYDATEDLEIEGLA